MFLHKYRTNERIHHDSVYLVAPTVLPPTHPLPFDQKYSNIMITPNDVISALTSHLKAISARIKPTEQVRITYSGDFGKMQAFQVTAHDERFLYIRLNPGEPEHEIIALPESCSVMVSVVPRKADEPPEPRVILGFSQTQNG